MIFTHKIYMGSLKVNFSFKNKYNIKNNKQIYFEFVFKIKIKIKLNNNKYKNKHTYFDTKQKLIL